jgi:dipeptidyl aminopeptidase/acylaminoacyl peptidase
MLRFLVVYFAYLLSSIALAQIPPAEFAKQSIYSAVKISPDGKHLALTLESEGKNRLAILKVKDFSAIGGLQLSGNESVGEFDWVNNNRIVAKILHFTPWDKEARSYGELVAVDFDGNNAKMIYGYRTGEVQTDTRHKKKKATRGWADIISLLPDDEDHILISSTPMSDGGGSRSTVYKLNVNNGDMRRKVAYAPTPYTTYIADRSGNLQLAIGRDKFNKKRLFRYENQENSWTEISKASYGSAFWPLALSDSGKRLYFVDSLDQDLSGLFSMNVATGERKSIYTDQYVDITNIQFNIDRSAVYAIRVDPDYPSYLMFETKSEEAQLFKSLLATFSGDKVYITSQSEDGNLSVVNVSNDLSKGTFYLVNKEKNDIQFLFKNLDNLKAADMSSSIPISFKASDGQKISGYITYPANLSEDNKVPLVTLVHGGPQVRDYWSFDREVQMLAAQGYAILRLNFRGSSGYGRTFLNASDENWGGRVQQDIIEGTQWAITQGRVQAENVCIMGFSFGGYSAVMSASLAPDLFKCVVAGGGVYDLNMMLEEGDIPDRLFGKAYLENVLGKDVSKRTQFSPVNNVQKLKAPVLIVHGEKDRRVPIEHAEALRIAMHEHNKEYEWFVKSSEAHGFYNEKNRTEYYEKVAGFLSRHLK